jgi:hypothetical protein
MTYTPRWGHSAVLLSDGRVLIAGGWNGENAVLSAEIYDYSTDSFSPASNLDEWSEQGVLLADGTVLLGLKLYDPVSGTFSQLAGYTPEGGAGTSLLLDGTVLVTGGGDTDPGISLATAELYDPSAGKYIATGDMTRCRFWHESSLLPDGSVLITGGDGFYCPADPFNYTTLASAEIYQPSTKAFTTAGYMTMARQGHTATLLNDGRVLIAGGFNQHGPSTGIVVDVLASAELYTPPVLVPPPVLLSLSGDGRGQGAILHASTQQLVSADNPAVAGELLEIYLTGLADLSVIPPQVAIGGRMAQVVWFGKAPGFDGLNQVNVRVPSGVISGSSSVPVRLNYIGRPSNEVTITVTMIGPLAAKQ